MRTIGWERVGAVSGLLFVALFFTAFFGLQDLDFPPAGSATAAEVRSFIEREQLRVAFATLAYTAGWAAFLLFVAGLRSPGTAPDGVRRLEWVAVSAGVIMAGLSLVGIGLSRRSCCTIRRRTT